MSDTTDLAALHAALVSFIAHLRNPPANADMQAKNYLRGIADELAYINTNLERPTNGVFANA